MPSYRIENAIVMRAGFRRLVQQSDLDECPAYDENDATLCHIYMICSRPRILVRSNGIEISPDTISVTFEKYLEHTIETIELKTENKHRIREYRINPGRSRLQFINIDGLLTTDIKTSLLYPCLTKSYDSILDLKVLYIGQAFGKEGERLATHRLRSHATLQTIYADILSRSPNQDPWLVLWHFEPYYISAFGSPYKNAEVSFEASYKHYEKILATGISLDQQITIAEAALIRYFSPEYNTEYKTSFPDNSHSSYSQCYALDFNSIAVELDTASIITRLWTNSASPDWIHVASYFLHSEQERVNMFRAFI
jgi:hypothetical protein